jgi:hypothetical protein
LLWQSTQYFCSKGWIVSRNFLPCPASVGVVEALADGFGG